MEVNPERKMKFEEGGGDADNVGGGRMEAVEDKSELREVSAEEMEENPPVIPSRKTEQLYKTHEKQFLAICPKEIWEDILEQLKNDPDAQTKCANASPYFWELLKEDRVLFLFPKVVEVIAPMANKRDFGMYVESADKGNEYKEEEPYFWGRKQQKDWMTSVLECRLVCTDWNKAVEQCYSSAKMSGQVELLADKYFDPRSPLQRMGMRWTPIFLFDSSGIRQFLTFFNLENDGRRKNPFFGRWIHIKVLGVDQNFNPSVTNLLSLFGKEVWYCVISWLDATTGKEVSSELAKWLGLMPNLKLLGLEGPNYVEGLSKKDFQENPIPKLEKLEILEFVKINGLILSEVLRVNCHVKVLRMSYIKTIGVDLTVGGLLENLKSFFTIDFKSGEKMLDEFGHHWNMLSRLFLENGSKYFGKLEGNWANTLVELELKEPFVGNKARILEDSKNLRLKLTGVRRLMLGGIDGLFYLDFIEPMQGSLEHLEIRGVEFRNGCSIKSRERVKKEQRFELVGFEERMHMSNVWKVFGKLETIKISICRNDLSLMFSKEGKKYLCQDEAEDSEEEEVDQSDSEEEGDNQSDSEDLEHLF